MAIKTEGRPLSGFDMTENEEVDHHANTKTNDKMLDLISSLKNLFTAEYIFGIYRFNVREGQLLPATWINKLYAICLIALNITMFIASARIPSMIEGNSRMIDVIDVLPCVVVVTQYVITLMITTLFFNKANIEMLAALAELDNKLMTNCENFYRQSTTKTNKFLIILILSHIAISILDIATDDAIDWREFVFLPLFLVQKIEIVAFCFIIEMLRSRLHIINRYLSKFLEEKEEMASVIITSETEGVKTLNMIGRPSENNMKIRDLAIMYDALGSICSMVNNIFNFQIFMTLVSTFCYIVITIWTSLYFYRTPEDHYGALITIIIWCVTTLLTVSTTCFICERLLSMRNTTKILVNQIIMDYSLPKIMRVQAKAFMELIEAWPLRILIYDMFSVDTSLILKFISVSTTYLIVIIQITHY